MKNGQVCPLCAGRDCELRGTLNTEEIARAWKEKFGFDVRTEFNDLAHFELHHCRTCSLQFFKPDCVAGSGAVYEGLSRFDWYYIARKWEHDAAFADLAGCDNGIEIGCGVGSFVERVIDEKKIAFEGCEQNAAAVELAQARHLPVSLTTAEALSESRPGTFAAVCAFQVLEHLVNPKRFLDACAALLRRGGKLMLGVPNADSFLKYQHELLDMPPHHMTRWTEAVLKKLETLFPLKLVRVAREPLADYHVQSYVDAYAGRLTGVGLSPLGTSRVRSWIAIAVRKSRVQRLLQGHTIYACFLRT